MSKALIDALAREEGKLKRQIDNHEAQKAILEVLGPVARELTKLERQEEAMKETRSNIAKLQKALK